MKYITEETLNMADAIARSYAGNDDDLFDELKAEAYLGLVVAENRFDESRGVKFTTYAYNWVKKHILAYLEGHSLSMVSLDELIEDDEGNYTTLGDMIPDEGANVEDMTIKNCEIEEMLRTITTLSEKEQDVLIRHYGLYDVEPETLEEIGKSYDVSKQAIEKTEKKALTKLRAKLS